MINLEYYLQAQYQISYVSFSVVMSLMFQYYRLVFYCQHQTWTQYFTDAQFS
jgi:hypothetical protein